MDSDTLLNDFATIAEAPGGIDQLRNTVLTLGINGHLSSTTPADESAENLIGRIEAETTRLVASKEMKKKKLAPPNQEEMPAHLADRGWALTNLGTCSNIVRGVTFPASSKGTSPEPGHVPCLRTANVQKEIDWEDLIYIPERHIKSTHQRLREFDIVMSLSNSRKLAGKIALNREVRPEATFGAFLGVIRPILVSAEFLALILRSPYARKELVASAKQTTNIANVSIGRLNELLVFLPSLEEQERIVTKVNGLLTLCDQLEQQQNHRNELKPMLRRSAFGSLQNAETDREQSTALKRVDENWSALSSGDSNGIDQLRDLILSLSVRGKLQQQSAEDEPATNTLASVVEDPSWRLPARERQATPDPSIEALVGSTPVPSGWVECRMEDCVQLLNGRQYKQHELLDAGTPVIRIQNLNGGENWYYSDLELPDDKTCEDGDLLFAWSASFGPYLWSGPRAIFHYHIWKIHLSSAVNVRYLFRVLQHLTIEVKARSHGLAMLHMTKGKMERWPILLPPVAEQQRIVARVDELMALCDRLEQEVQHRERIKEQFALSATQQLAN